MRTLSFLSVATLSASLMIVLPGSATEEVALAVPEMTCAEVHNPQNPPQKVGDDYIIASEADLVYLSVNQGEGENDPDGRWLTRSFLQTEEIDLGGCLFTPIGVDQDGLLFSGEYDGGGKAIKNLATAEIVNNGLFGATDGAIIQNVVLENAAISVVSDANLGSGYSGALVGTAYGTLIGGSSATGRLSGSGDILGGLVGYIDGGHVAESWSSVTIMGDDPSTYVGGLIGLVYASLGTTEENRATISDSYATGSVEASSEVGALIGGAIADIVVSGSNEDGIVTIVNSYATGTVTNRTVPNESTLRIDNLIGPVDGSLVVNAAIDLERLDLTGSFWLNSLGELIGLGDSGGPALIDVPDLDAYMADNNWSITEGWSDPFDPNEANRKTWGIRADLNRGYPYLLWQYPAEPGPGCGVVDDNGFHRVSTVDNLFAVGRGDEGAICGLDAKYLLTDDIDLADAGRWTPIGWSETPFSGTFDGGDFTIFEMTVVSESFDSTGGLFHTLENATIRNVSIAGARIDTSDDNGGIVSGAGLLASAAGGTTIDNVHIQGGLSGVELLGGGMVGVVFPPNEGNTTTTISNCSVIVDVDAILVDPAVVGGIAGVVETSIDDDEQPVASADLAIDTCVTQATLAVTLDPHPGDDGDGGPGFPSMLGGVVGLTDTGTSLTITDTAVTRGSAIDAQYGAIGGGLVGLAAGDITITNGKVAAPIFSEDGFPEGGDPFRFSASDPQGSFTYGGLIGAIAPTVESATIDQCLAETTITQDENDPALEVVYGGIVGAVGTEVSVDISACSSTTTVDLMLNPNVREFSTVFDILEVAFSEDGGMPNLEVDLNDFFHSFIGGAVGAAWDASVVTLSKVDVTDDSSVRVSDAGLGMFGGLIGLSTGLLTVTESGVGETPTFVEDEEPGQVPFTFLNTLPFAVGGLIGFAFPTNTVPDSGSSIVSSWASTAMTGTGSPVFALIVGGLAGATDGTTIRESGAHATVDFTVSPPNQSDGVAPSEFTASALMGGLVGSYANDTTSSEMWSSAATGTITLKEEDWEGFSELSLGGLVGSLSDGAVVGDSWTSVDITAEDVVLPDNGGVFVGGAFGSIITSEDNPTQSEVRNVLARGVTTVENSVGDFAYPVAGSFAGLIETIDEVNSNGDVENTIAPTLRGNFILATDGELNPVADGPSDGIDVITATNMRSITAYEDAGWEIVPASAGDVPSGPEDEIWGIGDSGTCAPYLWWQFDTVANSCLKEPSVTGGEDNTDQGETENTTTGGTETTTGSPTSDRNESSSDPTPQSTDQAVTTPPAPSNSAGPNPFTQLDTSTDESETSEEPGENLEPGEAEGQVTSDQLDTSDETTATPHTAPGINTRWWWAIGLGSLGVAALIAGGVTFARLRA